MIDAGKLAAAFAQMKALARSLPAAPSPADVARYHDIISRIEEASGESYSAFKISPKHVKEVLISKRPSMIAGLVDYTYAIRVDADYFRAQVEALCDLFSKARSVAAGSD